MQTNNTQQELDHYIKTKPLKVLLSAPVLTLSGYGVHARIIADALMLRKDVDLYIRAIRWGETSFMYGDTPAKNKYLSYINKYSEQANHDYDLSIQITIPNEFEKSMARYNVGVTAGIEVDRISYPWINKCNEMDHMIVPSVFVKTVMQGTVYKTEDGSLAGIKTPMEAIFEGLDANVFNPNAYNSAVNKVDWNFDTKFNFLFVGQLGKGGLGEDRKNIIKLIKLFCASFKDEKDVGLILKVNMYGNGAVDRYHTLQRIKNEIKAHRQGEYPKIHLIHGYLSDQEMAQLYTHPTTKAFVSLHHGEGYGLTLAQAAMCDLPILATDWSAPGDFLNNGKWIKLPFDLVEIPRSFWWKDVADPGCRWAEVKDDDVVRSLRRFKEKPVLPKENAVALGQIMRNQYSFDAFVKAFDASFNNIKIHYMSQNPEFLLMQLYASLDKKPSIGYVMPRHAGDVFNSTLVINLLKAKYPDHNIYFITDPIYFPILEGNPNIYKLLPYIPRIHDSLDMMKEVFDFYYTPHFDVQYMFSNWLHKNDLQNIAERFMQHCNVSLPERVTARSLMHMPERPLPEDMTLPSNYVVLHVDDCDRQKARHYKYWPPILDNIIKQLDLSVVLVGKGESKIYDNCVDLRNKTTPEQMATIIKNAKAFMGIDSFPAHLAAYYDVPSVILFGSSYAAATGPVTRSKNLRCLETTERYSCKKACYKDNCFVNPKNPCINNIVPEKVFTELQEAMYWDNDDVVTKLFIKDYPKISSYTTTYNCIKAGIPFDSAIQSALLFSDELVVVDGGSTDGTLERLQEMQQLDSRIVIENKEWDASEPGIDGQMKSYAKLMCNNPILWQFDADEFAHESDVAKIKELAYKLFNSDDQIVSLPVIELWGDELHATGRRHCWKWRMYKNSMDIIHDIPMHDKELNKETGRVYSKGGSDGCFPCNSLNYEMIPDINFYTANSKFEAMRTQNHKTYAAMVNAVAMDLPTIWHTSWMNLEQKVKQFGSFWAQQWGTLYQKAPVNRFWPDKPFDYEPTPEELQQLVTQMKTDGGEVSDEIKYIFPVLKEPPKYLAEYCSKLLKNSN